MYWLSGATVLLYLVEMFLTWFYLLLAGILITAEAGDTYKAGTGD
jgi:hypothetical protein